MVLKLSPNLVPMIAMAALTNLAGLLPVHAQEMVDLAVNPLEKWQYDRDIFDDPRQLVPQARQGLPDGRVTLAKSNDIIAAWYSEPTERYPHQVLGDKIEAGSLEVKVKGGPVTRYRLPQKQVFEDIAPRIVDLDGDGRMEVVAIVSSLEEGASLGIFALQGNNMLLEVKSSSGFVGKEIWLNPVAFSNFTGNRLQIAYVEDPEKAGKLVVADYVAGKFLQKTAEIAGYSNHKKGSNELRLSAIADFNGDTRGDIIIPTLDRKSLEVVSFVGGKLTPIARANFASPIDKPIVVEGSGRKLRFVVGLEDGSVVEVRR